MVSGIVPISVSGLPITSEKNDIIYGGMAVNNVINNPVDDPFPLSGYFR